jgi:hypothetical protein
MTEIGRKDHLVLMHFATYNDWNYRFFLDSNSFAMILLFFILTAEAVQ